MVHERRTIVNKKLARQQCRETRQKICCKPQKHPIRYNSTHLETVPVIRSPLPSDVNVDYPHLEGLKLADPLDEGETNRVFLLEYCHR